MDPGTNPAFRSRSLVRSRIGAFRSSDAGSNPAGSMPILAHADGSSSLGAVSELAFVRHPARDTSWVREPSSSFERASCRLYSPCRSHLYTRESIGPAKVFVLTPHSLH